MKKLFFLLFFIPLVSCVEDTYTLDIYDEFKVSLPGDVYYKEYKDDEGNLIAEILYNDDYEVLVTVYEGEDFEYFSNLNDYIDEVAETMEYEKHNAYLKKEYSDGVTGYFHLTYSKEDDSNVIFGVIQDAFDKKLYEIELICININSETARSIIESIYLVIPVERRKRTGYLGMFDRIAEKAKQEAEK